MVGLITVNGVVDDGFEQLLTARCVNEWLGVLQLLRRQVCKAATILMARVVSSELCGTTYLLFNNVYVGIEVSCLFIGVGTLEFTHKCND